MIKKQFLKFILLVILFFYLTKFLIYFNKNKENFSAKRLHNLGSNLQIYGNENRLIPGNPSMKITGKYSTYGNTPDIGRPYLQVEFTPNRGRRIYKNINLNPTNENEFSPFEKYVNLNTNESYTVRVTNKNTRNKTTNYGIMLQEFQVENPANTLN